ncbi:MAG: adenylate kinase [Clostridia bacterium]|nr:adenylate kinase [Clostridia bacterium]
MKIILFGAPGAGKGTQAELICQRLAIPSVSTGNIIREAIRGGTELGKLAKNFTDNGKLVPDEVVIGMIKERLAEDDCKGGFILDGFPRTVPQAEALDAMGVEIDVVLSIEVNDDDIERRMSGRRSCPTCGATFHLQNNPPKQEGLCDKCGAGLVQRADDAAETVRARLAVYHEQTEPVKDYYKSKGKLREIDGTKSIEKTTEFAFAALGI